MLVIAVTYHYIRLLLPQNSDCGTILQQNYDKLTSPSDNSVGR